MESGENSPLRSCPPFGGEWVESGGQANIVQSLVGIGPTCYTWCESGQVEQGLWIQLVALAAGTVVQKLDTMGIEKAGGNLEWLVSESGNERPGGPLVDSGCS